MMTIIDWIDKAAYVTALSSKGNPLVAVGTVFLFWLMFSVLEAGVEKLIWGERFEHWLDPIFMILFMCYAAWTVWQCAIINVKGVL